MNCASLKLNCIYYANYWKWLVVVLIYLTSNKTSGRKFKIMYLINQVNQICILNNLIIKILIKLYLI